MGIVYEAFDEERRAPVALKTLNRFDGDALARFKREFRSLQGISHPNLVALDELFFENEQWFFTMELLDGTDLVTHVRGESSKTPFASTIRESTGKLAAHAPLDGEVEGQATFDDAKLRDGLRQLLEGLSALHAADKVHRDIKPSNVMVTRSGRVVLLDFGLVTEASIVDRSTDSVVVGTPAYMAPEQAASREVGPAADLYAVGVMLFELLTGRLPFEGGQLQVLLAKQTREPPVPSSIAPGVPADLDALCAKLLRFDPSRRPDATAALRMLVTPRAPSEHPPRATTSTEAPTFVGRAAELAELRAAFDESARGKLRTVLVCGESGIGKSHTVRRFTAQLLVEHPDVMLLEGRCYEREAVPYKTLDGIVDALSRRLSRMQATEAGALLPAKSAVLAQVFPAMLRVPQVAAEHAKMSATAAPHELRQRAFFALRELLTRVADRRRTVIAIDDLQWADDDGLRALAEILRPPDAPPLLLVGTVRVASTAGAEAAGLERLRAVIPGELHAVSLTRLNHDEARELAVSLLRRSDAASADPESVATEAGGHPLFVEELARHVARGGSAGGDGDSPHLMVKLDDAIWSRVVELEPKAREMAELVAIAGKPIPQEVVAAATRFEPGEFNRRAATLRVANIVRTGGARWADAIEPYHDRVREAVLAQLDAGRRATLHEALAVAFEASSHHDPETLATHWREAGNAARAATYAERAGDQATATFAFDRAAQWFQQALDLLGIDGASTGHRELRVKLGHALAYAGRGALAAVQFEIAAAQSRPVEALELRRRVAEQLLACGHFDRGVEASRVVLAAIGMRMPTSRVAVLLSLLFYQAVLRLRGLGFREREAGQITAEELTRVDASFAIGTTLTFADTAVGFLFLTRALLLALSVGELERVARSVGMSIGHTATAGAKAWRRTEALIVIARGLAERSGTVASRAWATAPTGVAFYLNGRFREGVELVSRALEMTADGSTGLVWERVAWRMLLINALGLSGRFRELRKQQEDGLRDALARGDVYGEVNLRIGLSNIVWLLDDRADLAESNAVSAIQAWSTRGFHLEHYYGAIALACVKLYDGDAEGAFAIAGDLLKNTKRSLLWRLQVLRVRCLYAYASSATAMLEQGLGDRGRLMREAARGATALEKQGVAWALPMAGAVRAGLALRGGSREDAIRGLDDAARGFAACDMAAYAAAARARAARLRNGATSAAVIEQAAAFLSAEGVAAPEKMIRMHVPGFDRA
jgi:tRNA A-37 threonylcarbamoyl transferase component Bud32